jgi:hypothetical protein
VQPTVKMKASGPGAAAILSGLKGLTGAHVYVGIPEKTAARKGEPITNAQLAFIHTQGARGFKAREAMNVVMKGGKLSYSEALSLYIHTFGSPIYNVPPRRSSNLLSKTRLTASSLKQS